MKRILSILMILVTTVSVSAALTDDLVGYYAFDGGLDDGSHSANVNDAVAVGTPDLTVDGLFGNGVKVGDGSGTSYVSLGTPADYLFGDSTSFTITYWLKMPAGQSSDPGLIGNKNWSSSGGSQGFVQAIAGDDVKSNMSDGSTRKDTGWIDLDHDAYWDGQGKDATDPIRWTFVAITMDRDNNVMTNYVMDGWVVNRWDDGSTPTTADITGVGSLDSGNPINVGQDGDGAGYDNSSYAELVATFDDMAIWRRTLTEDELWEIYTTGRAGTSFGDHVGIGVVAAQPDPGNGETLVDVNQQLSWVAPGAYTPSGYELYFGTDPNVTQNTKVTLGAGVTSHDPGVLTYGATYYWRVDAVEPGDILHPGNTWSFETMPAVPVVTSDPASLTVASGSTAEFTVVATNADEYRWYKEGDGDVKGTAATLTLNGVSQAEEGWYYCVIENTANQSAQSSSAMLMTERLVAHWDFEGDFVDEVAGFTGDFIDPNVDNQEPDEANYWVTTDTINGTAFEFDGSGLIVKVLGSEDAFNFYPQGYTLSAWIKTTQAGYGAYVAKQDKSDGNVGIVLTHNGANAITTLRQSTNDTQASGVVVNDGNWHFVTGSYNREEGITRIYVDGKFVAQNGPNATLVDMNAQPVVFGAETAEGVVPFEGILDDVRIWSYPVDPYELAQMYVDFVPDAKICVDKVGLEYDFNDDCRVNLEDFVMFASTWLNCNKVPDCVE